MKNVSCILTAAALAVVTTSASAQEVLFTDGFESDASLENWTLVEADYGEEFPPDFDHFFETFDYTTAGLPPAPNSPAGETSGLQVFVNIGGFPSPFNVDAVNFYTNEEYSGNIRVSADVWLNWSSGGTTEYFGLGIFQSGDFIMNINQAFEDDTIGVGGDGYYFTMNGDGDSGNTTGDFAFSEFTPNTFIRSATMCGEWMFEDPANDPFNCIVGVNSTDRATADPLWQNIFPENGNAALASPGNQWVTVTMEYINGTINTYLQGTLVHSYTDEDMTYTSGRVVWAYEDVFGSNGEDRQWLVIDNFVVEQLDTEVSQWDLY